MQSSDEFIVIAMPFVFSALTIIFGKGVEKYAFNILTINEVKGVTPKFKDEAIKLTAQVYTQLGFIFSVLSSCVSCIAYTVRSPRPIFAAVGGFLLIILMPCWFMFWQNLSLEQLKGDDGKWMRISKWASILISFTVTLIARYYPTTPQS